MKCFMMQFNYFLAWIIIIIKLIFVQQLISLFITSFKLTKNYILILFNKLVFGVLFVIDITVFLIHKDIGWMYYEESNLITHIICDIYYIVK